MGCNMRTSCLPVCASPFYLYPWPSYCRTRCVATQKRWSNRAPARKAACGMSSKWPPRTWLCLRARCGHFLRWSGLMDSARRESCTGSVQREVRHFVAPLAAMHVRVTLQADPHAQGFNSLTDRSFTTGPYAPEEEAAAPLPTPPSPDSVHVHGPPRQEMLLSARCKRPTATRCNCALPHRPGRQPPNHHRTPRARAHHRAAANSATPPPTLPRSVHEQLEAAPPILEPGRIH